MSSSPPYTILAPLFHGGGTNVYRALRGPEHHPVVLKVLDPRRSRPKDLEQLRREYKLGRSLDTPAVVKPLALETYQGLPALVMEDFGGQSLDGLLGAPMAVDRFLALAVRIAGAVADVHRQGIVHKDLKPRNILVNLATDEVKITDFGLASTLPREHLPAQPARLIEGSLPYLSPEQTGRTNRAVDSRSDLYSLGVTFYEMLTGRLPFEAHDPVEWVHCHVARAPSSPAEVAPLVPATIARVVLKLLSKMPEDRYQTARGLRFDLERCLEQWKRTGTIEAFALGERDASFRLHIPERLFGRDAEISLLLGAFDRVVSTGTSELVLVSGYSGIGKSALVHELDKPALRERAFFLSGKFDQHQRDIPYAALLHAFREIVLEILAESESEMTAWRERLSAALALDGQLVVDVIPEVELVLGRQPPAPELPPAEAQYRFRVVLRRFIGVFARDQRPLVLFVDDLQWADLASLGLLEDLLVHGVPNLLVVGAYRDNEVGGSHPLVSMADAAREVGTRVSSIVLGPVPYQPLAALVAEALHCSREDAAPLSDLVYEKTGGNPFFAIQFLLSLEEERLIEIDERTGSFRWDVDLLRAKGLTDNVVDLMIGKLKRLPATTQEAVKQLACLGSSAPVDLLTVVRGGSEQEAHADVWDVVRAGLVVRSDGTYKFLHDRVQEAAYSLIPEGERAAMHLLIGRLLAARAAPSVVEEKIFEVVSQLDKGAQLITSREERERVAEWNLKAGERAQRSTAYAAARTFLAAGSALLSEDAWDRRYELAFALELRRAECEYLTGELSAAEERLAPLSCRARNLVDLAAVTCVRVALYTTLDRSDRAVEATLAYLRRVGIEWSPHPPEEVVQEEYQRTWRLLGSRSIESLFDLPPMTDPEARATVDVLTACQAPALFTDDKLSCLMIGRMANLSLERGNSDASCFAYVALAMVLGSRFGEYRRAFRFGRLAVDLVDRRARLRFKARVYEIFGYLVTPWTRHLREGIELVRRAFDTARETGDLTYASYACHSLVSALLAEGDPLAEVQREAESALAFVREAKFGLAVDRITGQLQLIRALRGLSPDFSHKGGSLCDELRFEDHLESDPRLAIAACFYWIRKLQARYFAGDHAAAVLAASKAERLLWTSMSFFEVAEYHFHAALARAAHYDLAPAEERAGHLAAIRVHHRQLEVWAASCPENFANRAALVAAEIARLGGEAEEAAALYEEAIRSARDNGFVQNEAIAYETAARFYRARGFELFADTYLREARSRYLRWGADGKARQMERQYPQIVEHRPLAPAGTLVARAEQLDLYAVAKAAQTISGEIVLDTLIHTLLEVVLEQGGAQRACLVLRRDGGLSVEAEAVLGESGAVTTVLEPSAVGSSRRVPGSILHYVQRTKERVILDDALSDARRFAGDEYFARARSKSVLCVPVLRQAEVVGLLYLENGLLAGAFTPDRLAALELLATQAAISLENALLLAKERAARAAAEAARVAAEAAEQRAAFLAEAGALLSESLDYEETFVRLGRLCVRSLADWCTIDVVEGREIRRLAVAHRDPAKEPALVEVQRRYPPRRGSLHPAAVVLRTGEPILMPELSDEGLRARVHDDAHFRLARELGTRTGLAVPLVARGQTLGVLSLASAAPGRAYGPADLALAQEIARRAASAIDNARLYRASQESARARREFLTVASHELNTPVTSLALAVEAMRRAALAGRPVDPETMGRLLEVVSRQGARLTRLTSDLLDVSRIEAGRLLLELGEVDLGALVRDVVSRFEADLTRSRCPVSIRGDAPVTGRWDRSRVEQVVVNLLSNAVKFGRGEPIEISLDSAHGWARLEVRDHGIGIAPDQRDRIFGRFERAVSESHYGGLGLGLYISRKIVEEHGGSIRCESRPGAGSTFTVELPERADESSAPTTTAAGHAEQHDAE